MPIRVWTFILLSAVTVAAHAQIRLPSAALPTLPVPGVPLLGQTQSLTQTLDQADARALEHLTSARRLTVDHLIRANRRVVDTDPHGDPVVRGEILALSSSEAALTRALAAGFQIARDAPMASDALRLVVLTAPASLSTQRALKALREWDADGTYEYNHLYTPSGALAAQPGPLGDQPHTAMPTLPTTPPSTAAPPSAASRAPAARPVRIGLLDTGIDSSHPVFHDALFHTWGCAGKVVPSLHGTAVASLLMPRATDLYSADVYCGSPTGGAVDAIIAALGWMTAQGIAVINVSLVGPRNAMLEKVVAGLTAHGYLIVAAVGNDGPAAPPLFPAAYPHVIGVTGVDAKRRVLLEAGRGPQVSFAAAGADIKAADANRGLAEVRGTSFAAPIVAALLAEQMSSPDPVESAAAVTALAARAIDLGVPGKDPIYGFGLVGADPALSLPR
jgi:hypothetical protein